MFPAEPYWRHVIAWLTAAFFLVGLGNHPGRDSGLN
jgi:hypothetical protein